MTKIFAKHGTDEKVFIICKNESVRDVQIMLTEKFGGNWVWVDSLDTQNEFLKFNDGLFYQGFHGNKSRYCNAILRADRSERSDELL